ncbi:MAG: hypothetical protein WBQ50_15925, partial [Nocardioides sp.]
RSTRLDLELHGPDVWSRFKTGREGFVWYHEEVLNTLNGRIPTSRSVHIIERELSLLVSAH